MHEKRFSSSEAWSVLLIFLDTIWPDVEKNFGRVFKTEYVFVPMLQIDTEFFQEWLFCCENYLKKTNSQESTFTHDQVQELISLYVQYYHSYIGFHLPVLIKYLDGSLDVTHFWEKAFTQVLQGERWRREEQSPELNKFLGDIGDRKGLMPNQAATLTGYFLPLLIERLCQTQPQCAERIDRFSSEAEGGDPCTNSVWKEQSVRLCCQPFTRVKKFSLEEVFSITLFYVVQHSYMYGFKLYEMVPLLYSMRTKPSLHPAEWNLWQKAVRITLEEGSRTIID